MCVYPNNREKRFLNVEQGMPTTGFANNMVKLAVLARNKPETNPNHIWLGRNYNLSIENMDFLVWAITNKWLVWVLPKRKWANENMTL